MNLSDPLFCFQRRKSVCRSWKENGGISFPLYLADPVHLNYLTGFWVDPFSLGAGFGAILQLNEDGTGILTHHDRLPEELEGIVSEGCGLTRVVAPWYDGVHAPKGIRGLSMLPAGFSGRIHDLATDPDAPGLFATIENLRRSKYPDELALIRRAIAAQEAGHIWARNNIQPGMTELEVYAGVAKATTLSAGRAVVTYGDFAVSSGPERKGGPPTRQVLNKGDLFILDFSVVLCGYRGDFTTTLAVGTPSDYAREMMRLCLLAMSAGEKELFAGNQARTVHTAVNEVFQKAGVDQWFGHHAGHGLGLTHPEAPFFVADSKDVLQVNDVVTLEPGLYIPGQGGMRIERNYRVGQVGMERLSHHRIEFN